MLKDIQFGYLAHDKHSIKMTKRIAHAIDALNSKKTLFQIEQIKDDDSSDEENERSDEMFPHELKQINMEKLKSQPITQEVSDRRQTKKLTPGDITNKKNSGSFKRRHSLQVGTNWLQEYSQFNMSAL